MSDNNCTCTFSVLKIVKLVFGHTYASVPSPSSWLLCSQISALRLPMISSLVNATIPFHPTNVWWIFLTNATQRLQHTSGPNAVFGLRATIWASLTPDICILNYPIAHYYRKGLCQLQKFNVIFNPKSGMALYRRVHRLPLFQNKLICSGLDILWIS